MSKLFLAVLAFAAALALAAPAQAERTSFFLMDAIKSDNGAIANGALAAEHGASAGVRDLGAMIVRDHTATREAAVAAAKAAGVGVPTVMTPQAQHMQRRLLRLSGTKFDEVFLTALIKDHRKAIDKYAEQRRSGDEVTKKLAEDALPHMSEHLRVALSLR